MTAAVPGPREDIDWSKHRGSCRVFYAERRCTCGAVPDPRFRDQLAEAVAAALDAAYDYSSYRWPQQQDCPRIADALMPTIAAEVEARVQAAANQRAAEELRSAADVIDLGPRFLGDTTPAQVNRNRANFLAAALEAGAGA